MKHIPITADPHAAAQACSEDDGTVAKLDLPLTRRSMLRGSGVLMGTLAAGSKVLLTASHRTRPQPAPHKIDSQACTPVDAVASGPLRPGCIDCMPLPRSADWPPVIVPGGRFCHR